MMLPRYQLILTAFSTQYQLTISTKCQLKIHLFLRYYLLPLLGGLRIGQPTACLGVYIILRCIVFFKKYYCHWGAASQVITHVLITGIVLFTFKSIRIIEYYSQLYHLSHNICVWSMINICQQFYSIFVYFFYYTSEGFTSREYNLTRIFREFRFLFFETSTPNR